MVKHICGQCTKIFSSELAYLRHVCAASGATPRGLKSSSSKPKTDSLLENKILSAVQTVRQNKKQYNA